LILLRPVPAFVGLKRAQILLTADAGATDEKIATSVGVSGSTVYRTKRRFAPGNLEAALSEEPRPGARRKLSGSRGTVRRPLAENELKPWCQDMWCIPQVDGEYVARMEDVLDLYAEARDPKRPIVCFDESPTQLIGEVRQPIPGKSGQCQRYDYEYKRNGTVNLFVFLDAHRPWRKVKVTDRRTAVDFAACMRDLTDVHYPKAERIRGVLDNLSTHTAGALYEAFPPCEARRMLERLEFHYVPKHASWLNRVEIEIGVLSGQCLDRRIGTRQCIESEIAAWERLRNAAGSVSNGCSQLRGLAPKWPAPILAKTPGAPKSKSHNHWAGILGPV
jgi:hypothetical protein